MKAITKYVTDDGREFTDSDEAKEYEALCNKVDEVMSELPPRPDNPPHGSIVHHHDPADVLRVRNRLLDVISTKIDHKWIDQSRDPDVHPSWVGRLVGDSRYRCLSQAWMRIQMIDSEGREWQQIYFANNPKEALPTE